MSASTLVIDSATDACSVALFVNNELVAGELRLLGRGHAEALVPMIAALPGRGRANRIAVSLGPGSFTGVRVGLAAARALGLAWGVEVVGYSTLSLIAAMARDKHGPVPVGVAMTGGHGEWFIEGFDANGASLRALTSLTPPAAAAAAPEDLVAGNQAQALIDLRGHGTAMAVLPDARAFALLPHTGLLPDLHPIYGRAPDARLPGGILPSTAA
ncbi:metal-dependent protease [Novosphingobium sp. Rr 2-17]|uniref:tRNA (adenosine(37)-N6)-threonylcarbamoyltransferase complex dimerization subunit type 1 TsaB n=1 Tax=Novosphingobium sp. Rr 2-17 TaxID=555793 RepID=UPI0002698BD1|nr:tRNA (adenosine(37)-N6)-threonylcarbamoyltransferase complex dimerization subunit type 1 TsaB [Novosphingobium sp. Rr 2-17]EIZ78639.1 metal-dependent protease [Novosphingobium sp. Rr 2-17]